MCSKSLQEEISSGKQIHCRKHHHGWLENKWVERERKNWTESCLLSPTLLRAPAKSRKPMSTWSVMEESLIPVVWLCTSLWCTCGCVEHFRRLLAQKSFFVVHVLCTCLLAFSVSLSAFYYRICFDMEIVSPVMCKPPNYSYNYLDIRLQNITADFCKNGSFEVKRSRGKIDTLFEVSTAALSFIHGLASLLEKAHIT